MKKSIKNKLVEISADTMKKVKDFVACNFVLQTAGPTIMNSCKGSVCVGCTSHCANSCTSSCEGFARK